MTTSDSLQPQFDFSIAPTPTRLYSCTATVLWKNVSATGAAEVLLHFLPSPRIQLQAKLTEPADQLLRMFFGSLEERSELSFFLDGNQINGWRAQSRIDGSALDISWAPAEEPLRHAVDMQAKTTVGAIFHLFNFCDFRGGRSGPVAAPVGQDQIVLESDEWRILVQSLDNGETSKSHERIKAEGGSFLTHIGKLERRDGTTFSANDAWEQRLILRSFLSFVHGGTCLPVCDVGLDRNGSRVWETWGSPTVSAPAYSWFNPIQAHQAEALYPLFVKRWQQSDEWNDCLRSAVYWYTQANSGRGSPGIDTAIILAQAALERLAYHHLVVDRKMISPDGLDRLKASDRLRMLFSSLNIPNEIVDVTPNIQRVAANLKWVDAPHAITDIRNELVHPGSKKQVNVCFMDAWKLSLWYLELSVLALCGYSDTYTSRLSAKYRTQSEKVPWGRKA